MQIKKINCNNSFTTACKTNIDDEFLTTRDMAIALIKPFIPQLQDKRIICPCDSEESEIYKYLKELNLNVDKSQNFEMVNYDNYDIVITNPPFSKMKELFKLIGNKHYLLIVYWHFMDYKWVVKDYLSNSNWKINPYSSFKGNKHRDTQFFTNLEKPNDWVQPDTRKINDGEIYSSWTITHTQRKDFALISLWQNGKQTFSRYIFGKDNAWIKENVKDLKTIAYNNYSKEFEKYETNTIQNNNNTN